MQRIERYGVIALVFLLVTILAVAVWGQRKNQSLLSYFKSDKPDELALVEPSTATGDASGLPLSDPSHAVSPTSNADANLAPGHAPVTTLLAPAGPGSARVQFDHGSALDGGANANQGFIDTQDAVRTSPPVSAKPEGAARTYQVKNGDTLGSIAQRELGSTKRWKEIEALNGVKPERLQVGMTLKLPSGAASSQPMMLVEADQRSAAQPKPVASTSGSRTYSVRSGDSLSKIASSQLGDANRYAEILALNPGLRPDKLAIGQTLRMPQSATAPSSSPKSKPRAASASPQVAKLDAPKKAKVQ